jgi:hypothetical protein
MRLAVIAFVGLAIFNDAKQQAIHSKFREEIPKSQQRKLSSRNLSKRSSKSYPIPKPPSLPDRPYDPSKGYDGRASKSRGKGYDSSASIGYSGRSNTKCLSSV